MQTEEQSTEVTIPPPLPSTTTVAERENKEVEKIVVEKLVINKEYKRKFVESFNDYYFYKGKEDYDKLEIKKQFTWIIDGEGIFLTAKNRIGEFTARIADSKIPSLPRGMQEKFIFCLPPIPRVLYQQIRKFFYDIADKMNDAEAFAQIYYDLKEKKYVVHIPMQRVSGGSVKYDAENNLDVKDFDRYIFVLEVHSHNSMSAFFSSVDDADEKECRFFGVFGKIKDTTPEFKLSFVVQNKRLPVDPKNIFDFMPEEIKYPADWINNVKTLGEKTGLSHIDDNHTSFTTYHGSHDMGDWDRRWDSEEYEGNLSKHRIEDLKKSGWNNLPAHVTKRVAEFMEAVETDKVEKQKEKTGAEPLPCKVSGLKGANSKAVSLKTMQDTTKDLRVTPVSDDILRDQLIMDFICEIQPKEVPTMCKYMDQVGLLEPVRSYILQKEG